MDRSTARLSPASWLPGRDGSEPPGWAGLAPPLLVAPPRTPPDPAGPDNPAQGVAGLKHVQQQLLRGCAELEAIRRAFRFELRALRRTLLIGIVLQAVSIGFLAAALVRIAGSFG